MSSTFWNFFLLLEVQVFDFTENSHKLYIKTAVRNNDKTLQTYETTSEGATRASKGHLISPSVGIFSFLYPKAPRSSPFFLFPFLLPTFQPLLSLLVSFSSFSSTWSPLHDKTCVPPAAWPSCMMQGHVQLFGGECKRICRDLLPILLLLFLPPISPQIFIFLCFLSSFLHNPGPNLQKKISYPTRLL